MWKWIKVPKGIALLAFLLPWLTVSCQNQPLAKATGLGLAFGHVTTMGRANGQSGEMNSWLILALLLIIGGLVLTVIRGRSFAKYSLGTSVGALLLIAIGTGRYSRSALLEEASRQRGGGGYGGSMGDAMMSAINVDWHFGYYLAMLALIIAAVMAGLVMTGRDAEASEKLAGLAGDARKAVEQAAAAAQASMKTEGGTCPKCGKKVEAGVKFCPVDGTPIEAPPPPPPPAAPPPAASA